MPRGGAVLVEKGPLAEVLCKPKILAIKSAALERAEAIEAEAERVLARPAAATKPGAGGK